MMKSKKIIVLGLILIFMLLFTVKVNAAETFSTNDGIVATKVVGGFSGDVEFKISNIPLTADGEYVWGIGTTTSNADIAKWYTLGEVNETNKTAKINLVVSDKDILNILRKTNTAYLYIKDNTTGTMLVDALKVDLTLPPYHAFNIVGDNWGNYCVINDNDYFSNWNSTYNIKNVYYQFVKVTDNSLINKYNKAVENNTSIENVLDIKTSDIEKITNWEKCSERGSKSYTEIGKGLLPADNELYILYLKGQDADSKTVYGYRVWPLDGKKVNVGNTGSTETPTTSGTTTNKKPTDGTTAKQILPKAGITTIAIAIVALISIVGIIIYIKYKNIPVK